MHWKMKKVVRVTFGVQPRWMILAKKASSANQYVYEPHVTLNKFEESQSISINIDLTWSNHARSTSWHSPRLESRGHCATWHVRVHSVQSRDTMTGMNPAKRIKEDQRRSKRIKEDQRGILLVEHGRTATFGHSPREECNLSEMIGYLARRSDVAFA